MWEGNGISRNRLKRTMWLRRICLTGSALSDPIQKFAIFGVTVVDDRLHHEFRSDRGRGGRRRRHRVGIKFSVPSILSRHLSTLRSAFAQILSSRDALDGHLCLADFRGFWSKVSGFRFRVYCLVTRVPCAALSRKHSAAGTSSMGVSASLTSGVSGPRSAGS